MRLSLLSAVVSALPLVVAACAAPARAPLSPLTSVPPPPVASSAPPGQLSTAPPPDLDLLRAMAQTRGYHLGAPAHATVTPDGSAVVFLRSAARDPKQSLYEMDVRTGEVRLLASPEAVLKGPESLSPEERVRRERMRVRTTGFTSLELSHDGAHALVTLSGRLFVVDRATGKARELPTGAGAAIDPHFSPDGTRVAYVRDDDVYSIAIDSQGESAGVLHARRPLAGGGEVRVTRGGGEHLTHGLAEFVAEEELDRTRGFWWAPDGGRLLYEEADTKDVDVLSIADPFRPEQPPQRIAYPRPGHSNASLRFGIVPAAGGATTWVQWERARFPYVAQAAWPEGGPPLLFVLDRLQDVGQLLAVDVATGKTKVLVEEHDAAWVNVDPSVPRWLRDGSGFLWSSERGGDWQLELRDAAGAHVRDLLPPGWGYASVADVDEKARTAVVVGSDDPTQAAAWVVSLDGTAAPVRLGKGAGVASVRFGRSHDRYVSSETSLTALPRWFVRSLDGTVAREIPATAEAPATLPAVELAEVGPERSRVAIVRPHGFRAGLRYPVIDAAYGGPGVTVVQQSALSFVRAQWMADATQAIVVAIDARGTPRRGRDWERALFHKLGTVPLEGHVAALEALGAKYPELDLSRVGVFGWSFGGYFAALAVLARPDFYKVAVAGAPPADWRDYDTTYTERYLGLPNDNPKAYDDASLLTYARKPGPSRPLLIVHGTADDNVWFLNSVKLTDALERGGRPFSLLPLAGTTHMLLDPDLSETVWLRTAGTLREALGPPT
jgi:dipeptidyl-peptidase-4